MTDSFKNAQDEDLDEVKIPNGFRLKFKDGEIVEFYADDAQKQGLWLQVLEQVLKGAGGEFKIPVWWPVVDQIRQLL